jgi:hypothetical protein
LLRHYLSCVGCVLCLTACGAGSVPGPSADAKLDAAAPVAPIDSGLDAAIRAVNDAQVSLTGAGADAARMAAGAVSTAAGSGGTAADGGTSGAAAGNAGAGHAGSAAGAGSTPAACSGAFCEDFETGSLRTAVWTRKETSNGNSVQVQSARVAHGQYAAQFHAKGGTATSMLFLENLPAVLQKHYFGRLYYYASDFPTESGGHTAYITSSNTLSGFPYSDHHLEVASYTSGTASWQMTYWTGDGPEYINSGCQIPKAQWFCLEWEFNDAPDEIGVWVDGDASTRGASFRNINNHASGLLGKMSTLGVGFRTWHPMGAPDIDVYIDDIVLDANRVGCL